MIIHQPDHFNLSTRVDSILITVGVFTWKQSLVYPKSVFSNFPLFGDGTEPPIRVHLIQDGVTLTHEFPIAQLLNCLSFKSLLHSGNSLQPPSENLLNSSAQEVMQQMLITGQGRLSIQRKS